jgi:hypothetical protein
MCERPEYRTLSAMPRLRDDRGQTSAEYIGMILVVGAIIAVVLAAAPGIGATITHRIDCAIGGCQGGPGTAGSPGVVGPGGVGGPNGTGPGGTGAPGSPQGGGGPSVPCVSAVDAAKCIPGVGAAVAKSPDELLARIHRATDAINRSGARTGTPEYQKLVAERQRLVRQYDAAKRLAKNPAVNGLNTVKKATNPSVNDLKRIRETPAERAARATKPKPAGAAGLTSKALKGLGIIGTGYTEVQNVRSDGVAKGTTKTIVGVAAAAVATTAVEAICSPLDLTGVGIAVCAGAGFLTAAAANAAGQALGGVTYDHVIKPVYDHVLKPIGRTASSVGRKIHDINPLPWP